MSSRSARNGEGGLGLGHQPAAGGYRAGAMQRGGTAAARRESGAAVKAAPTVRLPMARPFSLFFPKR